MTSKGSTLDLEITVSGFHMRSAMITPVVVFTLNINPFSTCYYILHSDTLPSHPHH